MAEYTVFTSSRLSSNINNWFYDCKYSQRNPNIRLLTSISDSLQVNLDPYDKIEREEILEANESMYSAIRKNLIIHSVQGILFLFTNNERHIGSNFALFKELCDNCFERNRKSIPTMILAYTPEERGSMTASEINHLIKEWMKKLQYEKIQPIQCLDAIIVRSIESPSFFDAFYELITQMREQKLFESKMIQKVPSTPAFSFSHRLIMWGEKHLGSIADNLGKILLDGLYRAIQNSATMDEYRTYFNSPQWSILSNWEYRCLGSKLNPDIHISASWSNSYPFSVSEGESDAYIERYEASYSTHRKNDLNQSNGVLFLFLNQKRKLESNVALFQELWDNLGSAEHLPVPLMVVAYTTEEDESLPKAEIELLFQSWINSQTKHTNPPIQYLDTVIISSKESSSLFDAFFEMISCIREKEPRA